MQATNAEPVPSLWLRIDGEETSCPACLSRRITHLEVLPVPRHMRPRVAFLTGCRDCGLVFWNPLPTRERLDEFYSHRGEWAAEHADRSALLTSLHRRREARKRTKKVERPRKRDVLFTAMQTYAPVLTPPAAAKALDIGCGDGKFLDALQDLGWDTYGIEPSSDVAFLRHQRLHAPPQDATFDFAILHHVLEHVTDPLPLLQSAAGALREGGALFISVPRLDTLPEHGDFRYCVNGRNHPLAFTEACLRGLLARAGFTAATLEAAALDLLFTEGRPLRLRVVATRTSSPPPLPRSPLGPAIAALGGYARSRGRWQDRWRFCLPIRMRGALMDRSRA